MAKRTALRPRSNDIYIGRREVDLSRKGRVATRGKLRRAHRRVAKSLREFLRGWPSRWTPLVLGWLGAYLCVQNYVNEKMMTK